MGLVLGYLEKVPCDMTVQECYERIYNWFKKYGEIRIKLKYKCDDPFIIASSNLIDALPSPAEATIDDMNFVFGEIKSHLLENSFHEEDEYGIKIGAYAEFAIGKQFGTPLVGDKSNKFNKSRESSRLYPEFNEPKIQENLYNRQINAIYKIYKIISKK